VPTSSNYFHLHLVSDSTGETLITVARAVAAQYANVTPVEHVYPLVRSQKQLDRVLAEAHQHLRRGLSADAAINVSLAGKIFIQLPKVGDGIAEEDHTIFPGCRRLQIHICPAITSQFSKVIFQRRKFRFTPTLQGLLG